MKDLIAYLLLRLAELFLPKKKVRPMPEDFLDKDPADRGYYELCLLPQQRTMLMSALRAYTSGHNKRPATHKATLQELELAKKVDLELPRPQDRLDWDSLEQEANRRGGDWGPAELIADGWTP